MKKALGLALALTLTLALSAAAEQAKGTIYSVNPADHSIVLDDGTRLWVSEGQFADLSLGDQVQAAYETKDDKKIVIQMARPGLDGSFDPLTSVQAGDN
jgi:Cu/Ag efflux protein CusF